MACNIKVFEDKSNLFDSVFQLNAYPSVITLENSKLKVVRELTSSNYNYIINEIAKDFHLQVPFPSPPQTEASKPQ